MEFDKVVEARQSVRRYVPCEISEEELAEMVRAAGMAPSADNSQNWHFVGINKAEILGDIAEVVEAKWQGVFDKLAEVDEERSLKMQKFAKHFFYFFKDASAIILAYANEIEQPVGDILEKIGEEPEVIKDHWLRRNNRMQNMGAALENLTLKAVDMGYGSCWLNALNYASPEIDAYLKEKHGFEVGDRFLAAVISIGKPAPNPKSPKKKPIEEIFTMIG